MRRALWGPRAACVAAGEVACVWHAVERPLGSGLCGPGSPAPCLALVCAGPVWLQGLAISLGASPGRTPSLSQGERVVIQPAGADGPRVREPNAPTRGFSGTRWPACVGSGAVSATGGRRPPSARARTTPGVNRDPAQAVSHGDAGSHGGGDPVMLPAGCTSAGGQGWGPWLVALWPGRRSGRRGGTALRVN